MNSSKNLLRIKTPPRQTVWYGIKLLAGAVLLARLTSVLSIASPAMFPSQELSLSLAACLSRISTADRIARAERDVLETERTAFKRFTQQVREIDATPIPTEPRPTGGALTSQVPKAQNIRAVSEAYRETVMAMPHYDADYGEELQQSMAMELGPELVTAVAEQERFTPQLKRALIQASTRAREERSSFIGEIDTECEHLQDAENDLSPIVTAVSQLADDLDDDPRLGGSGQREAKEIRSAHDQLEAFEIECEQTVETRQNQLHRQNNPSDTTLQEYLYADQQWTYPVLDGALDCLRRIRQLKRQLAVVVSRLP